VVTVEAYAELGRLCTAEFHPLTDQLVKSPPADRDGLDEGQLRAAGHDDPCARVPNVHKRVDLIAVFVSPQKPLKASEQRTRLGVDRDGVEPHLSQPLHMSIDCLSGSGQDDDFLPDVSPLTNIARHEKPHLRLSRVHAETVTSFKPDSGGNLSFRHGGYTHIPDVQIIPAQRRRGVPPGEPFGLEHVLDRLHLELPAFRRIVTLQVSRAGRSKSS
jgi:hypothetical protein